MNSGRIRAKITGLVVSAMLIASSSFAAGGGGSGQVIVADTRRLTGILAWWSALYNDSRLWFTILSVIVIPIVGVIFGVLADFIMSRVGIDLTSRDLAEH